MKNIFDFPHVKGVRAWVLMYNHKMVGKIVANFSDNPAGSVCTAQVIIYGGPLYTERDFGGGPILGKAGGYGYDKFSAAVASALHKMGLKTPGMAGAGDPSVRGFFTKAGYEVIEAI